MNAVLRGRMVSRGACDVFSMPIWLTIVTVLDVALLAYALFGTAAVIALAALSAGGCKSRTPATTAGSPATW